MFHPQFQRRKRRIRFGVRHAWIVILVLAFLLSPSGGAGAQDAESEYVPGEILLGWRVDAAACDPLSRSRVETGLGSEACRLLADLAPTGFQGAETLAEQRSLPEWQAAARALATLTGLEVRDLLLPYGAARLGTPSGSEAAEIERLSQEPWVAYAELNHIARAASPSAEVLYPNDPYIGDQWNMRRVAAPEAWAITQGSYSIVVAVLDSGIDLGHTEFSYRLMPGYDYVNKDNTPNDDYGHGTHVAGIIAANANNAAGVSGLAPNVKLLPHKVLNWQGVGTYFNIATAIIDATNANVQVINLSLGGFASDTTLQNAVNFALGKGKLVVAASGNCGQGGSNCSGVNPLYYPAAYAGVLAVGASDHYDNIGSYSGYKPYVGLAAPGGTASDPIWSTWPGSYSYLYGTSMATPLVSAAAALVWTMQPAATAQTVADILKSTADKAGSEPYVGGRNDYFGYGRLNVARAVRQAYPPSLTPANTIQYFLTDNPQQSSLAAIALRNPSEQPVAWQASVTQGAAWLNVDLSSGQATFSTPGTLVLRAGPAALPPGSYTGTVRVTSPATSFDLRVDLRVAAQLQRAILPMITRDWYGVGWLDPFTPDAPAPTPLSLSDNSAYPVTLPFPVTFFGRSYTAAWVSDNGLVWFGGGSAAYYEPPTACLPSAAAPNNAIYVLALDWKPALGGRIYTHRPDANTFAITWYEVQRPWLAVPQSFQLIFRRTGEIAVSYNAIEALPPAIIGVENDDGTVAEQLFCNGSGRLPSKGNTFRLEAVLPWQ